MTRMSRLEDAIKLGRVVDDQRIEVDSTSRLEKNT